MELWETLRVLVSKLGCGSRKGELLENDLDREQVAVPPPVVKVRRFHERGDTLLAETVTAIARNIWCHSSTDLSGLPADLAQLILEDLIVLGRLSRSSLALFSNQLVYSLRLEDYPGVGNDWLSLLCKSSLLVVNLSRCTQVGDQSLAALEGQTCLEQLHLDGCHRITDEGLSHIAGLSRLQHLSLEDCKQLTSGGVEHLAGLSRLTCLNLRACSRVCGLHHIAGIVELRRVNVGWCTLVGDDDVAALATLTRLVDLELARSQVGERGVSALAGLPGLTGLDLAGCGLTDACMPHLAGMSRMKALNLMWCGGFSENGRRPSGLTQKGLMLLGGLRELQEMNVAYNPHLSDSCLLEWEVLTNLRVVSLDSCSNISNRGLAVFRQLTNVQELDLSDTAVDDHGLLHLSGLRKLNHLNLSFTGVTDAGLGELTGFSELTRLHLDTRGVGNSQGARNLGRLTQLRHLDLFGSRISDRGCQHLSGLTQLQCLEICNGLISDKGVDHFHALANLRSLSLATNASITDVSLLVLSNLLALTSLNLAGCRITGNGIQTLHKLTGLEMLVLKRTRARKVAGDRLRAQLPRLHSVQC